MGERDVEVSSGGRKEINGCDGLQVGKIGKVETCVCVCGRGVEGVG